MSFSSSASGAPPKESIVFRWNQTKEYESFSTKHRSNLNNDRFHDVSILCSDGKTVRCQSYMLRVASDVFDEMLGSEDFDKQEGLISPRFASIVMETVKYYCHLGQFKQSYKMEHQDLEASLEVLVAADYYNIGELGAKCLNHVKKIIEKKPNLAFMVASKFGLAQREEDREMVASAMAFAGNIIADFHPKLFIDPFIEVIAMIRDKEILKQVVELIPMTPPTPSGSAEEEDFSLLPMHFVEKWVSVISSLHGTTSGGHLNLDPQKIGREVLEETDFTMKVAALQPDHLLDGKGIIRTSNLASPKSILEAIYNIPARFSFVGTPTSVQLNKSIRPSHNMTLKLRTAWETLNLADEELR